MEKSRKTKTKNNNFCSEETKMMGYIYEYQTEDF